MKSQDSSTYVQENKGKVNIYYSCSRDYDYISQKLPSLISDVVYRLSEILEDIDDSTYNQSLCEPKNYDDYDIEEKIEYNNLKKYKVLVEDYGVYGYIVDSVYSALDMEKPNSKKKFMQFIKLQYKKILGELLLISHQKKNQSERIDIIREHSDLIMDKVQENLKRTFLESNDNDKIFIEELDYCLTLIACHAFIDCKILERPITCDNPR